MRPKSPLDSRPHSLIILFLGIFVLITIYPAGNVFADANLPTITPTLTATKTPEPQPEATQTQTQTNVIAIATEEPQSVLVATSIPAPQSVTGGLSLLNRILLVLLAVVTVIVIGVIVYAVYYRTQREGLEDR